MVQNRLHPDTRIYVAGHSGLAGSAIWRHLESLGYSNLIGWRSYEVDLREPQPISDVLMEYRPDVVILAAARVGGIFANNTYPVEFLIDNIKIQNNVLEAAHLAKVPRLLFLGSSCIYPKFAPQPIVESSLMTGPLEPTNEAYAIAKIAGIALIQAFRKEYGYKWISAMPTNLYGPGDNYELESAHVLAALIRRFSEAVKNKSDSVTLWGSGTPRREFLHSDDLASAVLTLLESYDSDEPVNIGTGIDISIRELAEKIASITGYSGEINWNIEMPDGTPRKVLDVSKLRSLGWSHRIELDEGLERTCREFSKITKS